MGESGGGTGDVELDSELVLGAVSEPKNESQRDESQKYGGLSGPPPRSALDEVRKRGSGCAGGASAGSPAPARRGERMRRGRGGPAPAALSWHPSRAQAGAVLSATRAGQDQLPPVVRSVLLQGQGKGGAGRL